MGIITDLADIDPSDDETVDYFVIISGPEPQRTKFEKIVIRQLDQLKGRVVITLGIPEKSFKIRMGNAEIYAYMNRLEISRCLSRTKMVISRPGYTTVMEMIEMGKRGLFIPTPGQIEQEYLAKHFKYNKWCYYISQYRLELKKAINIANSYEGFPDNFSRTKENLDKLFNEIIEN